MNPLVSFRIEPELSASLQSLMTRTGQKRSCLINKALAHYLEHQRVQTELIHEGLADAQAGNLINLQEIERKWGHDPCLD
ncbi:transcriptional regulator [Pseudomonas sp. CDFA 602]|uniref:CopG family ribbon-helix-helix protein n=1 Tax=Pseudomonas californiensis TaxID=2829823 RepID=UPI001E485F5B|nr:transcriptional regulator [Pseudomonas californiensis]MCD5995646.1 transcriptional regulator [Pseudomonas californiensis]MCD6001240.1 transcriptional regulator [Pseudomonas californiensis]